MINQHNKDKSRFDELLAQLGGNNIDPNAFNLLMAAYSEPHRHYHTVTHLADCLSQFDLVRDEVERPDETEAALWFHDVVYDPRTHDNEDRSAEWAKQMFCRAGVPINTTNRVAALVLLTKHNLEPESQDGAVLLDIDLSILGSTPDRFETYETQIRCEYEWVPWEKYRAVRVQILAGFLRRPYRTEFFRSRYELQARRNLEHSIRQLTAS